MRTETNIPSRKRTALIHCGSHDGVRAGDVEDVADSFSKFMAQNGEK
jgi:hypothetical protein